MRVRLVAQVLVAALLPTVATAQATPPLAASDTASGRPIADACETSYQRGAINANVTHSTTGWRTGGFASGLVFSVIGVAGATLVASTAPAAPPRVPESEVSSCFRDGYRATARSRSRRSALRSGLVGAAILPVLYIVRVSLR